MELLATGLAHLPEIVASVMIVLGGQKGYEVYKRKRFANGGHDRRKGNSFAESDKEFIQKCFVDQTRSMASVMKLDRLELIVELGDVIRDDGDKTRTAVRGT